MNLKLKNIFSNLTIWIITQAMLSTAIFMFSHSWSGQKSAVRGGGGIHPPAGHTLLLSATPLAMGLSFIKTPYVCLATQVFL